MSAWSYRECPDCGSQLTGVSCGCRSSCPPRGGSGLAPPTRKLLPTPAEVREAQTALRPEERVALARLGSSLRAADRFPLTYAVSLLAGCRVERVTKELERRGWKVVYESDPRAGDYLSITGA